MWRVQRLRRKDNVRSRVPGGRGSAEPPWCRRQGWWTGWGDVKKHLTYLSGLSKTISVLLNNVMQLNRF